MSFSIVTLTALIRFILVSCASVVTLTALIRFILLSCVLILLVLVVDIPEQVSPEPLGPKNVHRWYSLILMLRANMTSKQDELDMIFCSAWSNESAVEENKIHKINLSIVRFRGFVLVSENRRVLRPLWSPNRLRFPPRRQSPCHVGQLAGRRGRLS